MDLSRLSTLSLNNSIDIIANNISLINGNKTNNILDLFVLKNEYELTEQTQLNNVYTMAQTYSRLEIINLFIREKFFLLYRSFNQLSAVDISVWHM